MKGRCTDRFLRCSPPSSSLLQRRNEQINEFKLTNQNEIAVYLHQRPLRGDDVVRLAIFVDESGVGLDPLPAVILGEQPEDSEAALTRLNHWSHIKRHIRVSVSLLFTEALQYEHTRLDMCWRLHANAHFGYVHMLPSPVGGLLD